MLRPLPIKLSLFESKVDSNTEDTDGKKLIKAKGALKSQRRRNGPARDLLLSLKGELLANRCRTEETHFGLVCWYQ